MIDQDLYKSFVYLYFYIRPVKMFILRTLIKNSNTSQFSYYLKYVWIYLVLNIIMETLLFLLNKAYVVKQLSNNREYLLLFEKCIA